MLSKIVGIIWIALGLLWLVKPEILKNRLKRKMNRKIKWIIYGFIFMFVFLLIGSIIRAHGLLPKIVGLIGIIVTIRAIVLVMSKASEKILNWWADRPLKYFRIWALIILITGLMLFILGGTSRAEDMSVNIDGFYNGLAEIIERNMDSPDRCVKEVEDYYRVNQATVERARKMAEERMAAAMAMLNKYKTMGEEELEALEEKYSQYDMEGPSSMPGSNRYAKALNSFIMKYPHQGSKIARKAMQFAPRGNILDE